MKHSFAVSTLFALASSKAEKLSLIMADPNDMILIMCDGLPAQCYWYDVNCYNYSEVYCGGVRVEEPMPVLGGTRTIECADGRTVQCSAGT